VNRGGVLIGVVLLALVGSLLTSCSFFFAGYSCSDEGEDDLDALADWVVELGLPSNEPYVLGDCSDAGEQSLYFQVEASDVAGTEALMLEAMKCSLPEGFRPDTVDVRCEYGEATFTVLVEDNVSTSGVVDVYLTPIDP